VTTAVGLVVAIPAVAAFNTFQRIVKTTLANTDALGHVLLAHLRAEGGSAAGTGDEKPAPAAETRPAKAAAKGGKHASSDETTEESA